MKLYTGVAVMVAAAAVTDAFAPTSMSQRNPISAFSTAEGTATTAPPDIEARRKSQKEALLGLIGSKTEPTQADPILACPETKEPIRITRSGAVLGGDSSAGARLTLRTSPTSDLVYTGRTDTYYNLLEAEAAASETKTSEDRSASEIASDVIGSLSVFVPPPVRSVLAITGLAGEEYVPMRDLFTSPSVSFAYERGWRQGFSAAGFPGPDREAELVREYFEPAVVGAGPSTVVDMSCATGLFARRLAKSNDYDRVLGCDYSDSMLREARRRIKSDPELNSPSSTKTRLDLVRLDVGNIPMQTESVDALHAGAAMHCWPDLDAALSEINRVLKPGGRFFATTFLAQYFRGLQTAEGAQTDASSQAFQYFESVEQLKDMVLKAGFEEEKVSIEVLGRACVVIRAEK